MQPYPFTNRPISQVALVVALLLGGCAITGESPEPLPIAAGMPTAWAGQTLALPDSKANAIDWWRNFNSDELPSLINSALNDSPNLMIAGERVRQAEAQVSIAGASLFPVISLGAGTTSQTARANGGTWSTASASSSTLSARYEIDLWGKNAAGRRASQSSLLASSFDVDSARLTLVAGVADAYFRVLSLRGRLAIARKNLLIAEQGLALVQARVRNGIATELELASQQTLVLVQRAAIPSLELQESQTLFALALLLGRTPQGFEVGAALGPDALANFSSLAVPRIAPGLPSDLITHRPDLASSEAKLEAAKANVTVARAALLPTIQLTGSAGLASDVLLNFLNAPTAALSLGGSLLQSIFDGGRLNAQVELSTSVKRELVENYRQAILAALADVENTLASSRRTTEQGALQEQVVTQATKTLRLSQVRYREGAGDLLSLLDAQRTLFQAEDQLAQIRLAQLQASIGLYKALGGGWSISSVPPEVKTSS
ncbi:MAG: efflux transporter outer membrane subunit [Polaromonas sp.]